MIGKKFKKVMREYGEGDLHSGSKKGPRVKNPKQAVAIAFSEQRKANKTSKGMTKKKEKIMKKKTPSKCAPKKKMKAVSKVKKHLKNDMKMFKEEAKEDKNLLGSLSKRFARGK